MEALTLTDPAEFLALAGPLLLSDEARHNLILGLAGTIRADESLYPERRFWVVRDGGRAAAAALRTPPYNLVLARPASEAALEVLVVAAADEDLPGVVGALPEVEGFSTRWARAHAVVRRLVMRQGVYALERVEAVPPAPGAAREARPADRELLVRWWGDFADEALHEGAPGHEHSERSVDHRLAADDSGILLWEDGGEVVSLASWGGPTPSGIRIGPVYTPPARRGHGYATSLVAELSGRLLAAGSSFCFLYTDLANRTANEIYSRIGYARVCDSAEIAFDPR